MQVRFLQILADKVVESLRTASDEKSPPDATISISELLNSSHFRDTIS